MGIIETAKRNNLDIHGYLLYLLTNLPNEAKTAEAQLEAVSLGYDFACILHTNVQ